MKLSKSPRCFHCFKNVDVQDQHQQRNDKITITGRIEHRSVCIYFCSDSCKNQGSFQRFCDFLELTKSQITLMEEKLSKETFPEDFLYHDMEDHLYCYCFSNHNPIMEGDFCGDFDLQSQIYAIPFEDFSPELSEEEFDDEWTDSEKEFEIRFQKKRYLQEKYKRYMAKKHYHNFAILHMAERVNSKELYEEYLDLLVKFIQSSSVGSCQILVSIVATLMNLNRLEEAYGIIVSQIMNKNQRPEGEAKELKSLSAPKWFNLIESKC